MRLTASVSIAAVSTLAALTTLHAARRPHYGGTLRIETQSVLTSLDPAQAPANLEDAAVHANIGSQLFETLVRLNDKAEPRPLLASSWSHDPAHKHWRFTPRRNIAFTNGAAWEPSEDELSFSDNTPVGEILRHLTRLQKAIVARGPDGSLLGTGPFRIAAWDAGKSVTLEANDRYWGGRPYLDRVEVRFGRTAREQALDLELGRADVIELPPADVRRVEQLGARVAVSAPVRVLALLLDTALPEGDRLRDALALSIDRAAIRNVLLQHQGDVSGALLPQWLSGYAFLFPAQRDLTRARELAAHAPPLEFGCDRPSLRPIAERIIIDAAEAGLTLRLSAGKPDVRLVSLRVTSVDGREALRENSASLGAPPPSGISDDPDSVYEAERTLLTSRRIVPIVQLPSAYQLAANVRGWTSGGIDEWRLADVWLDARP